MRWTARHARRLVATALTLLVTRAADAGAADKPEHAESPLNLRHNQGGGADAALARSRVRAGDCDGALTLFDRAIRTSIEPTLWRDRGLCHEKLGHPFPAADDYRAYLVARPNAADAEQIRERLDHLETETAARRFATATKGDALGEGYVESTRESVSLGATASITSRADGPSKGESTPQVQQKEGQSYDDFVAQEKAVDDARSSPLRSGRGFIVGAFLHIPRYFFSGGEASDLAYAFGATVRYATGPRYALVSEVGLSSVGTSGEASQRSGPLVFLGGEARFDLTKLASNQLVFGGGLAFESLTTAGTQVAQRMLEARLRGGLRHLLGPSVGLDLMLDGGPAYRWVSSGSDSDFLYVLGGSVALLVGF